MRLLVVDDGSTDATSEILEQQAADDDRIELVRNPANQGRPRARNRIIELAGSDYLAWIDSGDLWHPRKLELQMAVLLEAERVNPEAAILCTAPLRWAFVDDGSTKVKVPEVEGDQLYNALIGTLPPYLQAMLGHAEHFRAAGGFDEGLLRRQDYDFLVRFVAEGGQVVSTSPGSPLVTYLKSDVGRPAELVAAANKIIREKHQPYYQRYGRATARQIERNQHLLVARFHRGNGAAMKAFHWRVLAWWRSPGMPVWVVTARRALRPAKLAHVGLRGAKPLITPLNRLGVIKRLGRTRLGAAASARLADSGSGQGLSSSARGDKVEQARKIERSIETLEKPAPQVWLELEQAYRTAGLLFSAESALRRGLEAEPDDDSLVVALVELLPLRRKWHECTAMWTQRDVAALATVRPRTYARVAWAYRKQSEAAAAFETVEEGLRRWPTDKRLLQEYYVARAGVVDWPSSVLPDRTQNVAGTAGAVTDLGFLHGYDRSLSGHLEGRSAIQAADVSLVVNDVAVATTQAAAGSEGDRPYFAINCTDLLLYLGDDDIVSVVGPGRPLMIADGATYCRVRTGYASRFGELQLTLTRGYVFTKFGTLRLGNSPERKRKTLKLYETVGDLIREHFGYKVYPFYGHLLGAVREHDFIGHDVGGFDMAYVSRHNDADAVKSEFTAVCSMLLKHGYFLRLEPWSTYVRHGSDKSIFVDVNYAWFTEAGELNASFGWRGEPVTDISAFNKPRQSVLGFHLVDIPGNAEEVLAQMYGPTWHTPNQGFDLNQELIRKTEYLLTDDEMEELRKSDPDRIESYGSNGDASEGEIDRAER
jgi:tetratricopeptide (TPR) repeat protein